METKVLMTPNGNHTGSVDCLLSYDDCVNVYTSFFKYMAEIGWSEFKNKSFLRKTIIKYSNTFEKECEKSGLYNDDEIKRLKDKFKGNALEIIAEGYFRFCKTQKHKVEFLRWCGMEGDDLGIDGYCVDRTNKNYLVAVQAKFRSDNEIGWQDGIQKAYTLVNEEMKEKWLNGAITGAEYLEWHKLHPVILFTSTTAKYNMKAWADKWMLIIDDNEIYENLGMYNETGNKNFWETLYNELEK